MDAKAITQQKKHVDKFIRNAKMDTSDVLCVFGAYYDQPQNKGSVKNLAMVLKAAYDEDWLEEEKIISYYEDDDNENHPGFSEAQKAAAPFIKWLKTVESDDDAKALKQAQAAAKKGGHDDDEDSASVEDEDKENSELKNK